MNIKSNYFIGLKQIKQIFEVKAIREKIIVKTLIPYFPL